MNLISSLCKCKLSTKRVAKSWRRNEFSFPKVITTCNFFKARPPFQGTVSLCLVEFSNAFWHKSSSKWWKKNSKQQFTLISGAKLITFNFEGISFTFYSFVEFMMRPFYNGIFSHPWNNLGHEWYLWLFKTTWSICF